MASDLKTEIAEPEDDSVLPPGQRDDSGFWLPLDCTDPKRLVRKRGRRGPRRRGEPAVARPSPEPVA